MTSTKTPMGAARFPRIVFLVAGLMALIYMAPAHAATSASASVDRFHAGLVDSLKATNGKSFSARRTALKPVITGSFDSGFMAKVASGSTWDSLNDTQRAALTTAFRDMTIANYASRFKSYNGQTFVVLGSEPAPNGRTLVHTQLNRKTGDPVKIDYVMASGPKPDTWSIIDVRLNGAVSELALRRSEFAPVLRDKGFDALMAVLKDKIAALETAPSDVDPAPGKP